jgi:hypothetical protein
MKAAIPRGKGRAATFQALGEAILSTAAQELSPAQAAYQELLQAKCEKMGINHPFELEDPNDVKKFFDELSADWAIQKDDE